ncbi:MAG: glutamyl-tRNA reductase [Pseudomonadota bacterium]|jgi:glutamyl-tRNA reductase
MLQPVIFGLNYQTASFELRDRLAFASEEVPIVLRRLINSGVVKEALLLSTCNRTELYCIANDIDFVINALCDLHNVCPRTIRQHSYVYNAEDCAHHLFRVVSGLESMVLGESEIVAQIKTAMELATNVGALGTNLAGLFQMALSIEKEVRSHTEINNVAISMGHAVVNYIENKLTDLPNRNVLFVGAGQMMQQIAPHFAYLDLADKLVVNRSLANAGIVAAKIGANIDELANLPNLVAKYATIVICCASNVPLIHQTDFKNLNHEQLIIDLSMPLAVEHGLKQLQNITLLTIDDIAKLVDVGLDRRKLAAIQAEQIIEAKLVDYRAWVRKRGLSPLIRKLREQSEQIRLESLAQAEKQLLNGESAVQVLKQLSVQLTNRLLHNPTVNLCAASGQLQDQLVDLLEHLYSLEE